MTPWPVELAPLPAGVPGDRPVALLIRHAKRPAIPHDTHGADLALTEHGRHTARTLGVTLGPRILSLSTSPVRRCRETADAIRRGANARIEIVDDPLLGDPGVYVVDPDLAWTRWSSLGHESILEHLAHSSSPLPGFADPALAARRLTQHLLDALHSPTIGFHIFITHDSILYPTATRLLKTRSPLPEYLEAAALWNDTPHPIFCYRHTRANISSPL